MLAQQDPDSRRSSESVSYRQTNQWKYWWGMLFLLMMIVFWISSSFSIQYTLTGFQFHGVFFTTYIINTVFAAILLLRAIANRFNLTPGKPAQPTLAQYIKWACLFGPMWCIMNAALNSSLQYTSVASNNSLSTLSSAFALLAGYVLVRDVPNIWKLAGIGSTIAGAVLVGLPDSQNNDGAPIPESGPFGLSAPIFGDILEIISAFVYGFYTSLIDLRVAIHNVDMANFFGFCGIANLVLFSPVILALDLSGVEILSQITPKLMLMLLLNGGLSISSDYFLANAVVLTSPLVANIGLSLTIPITVTLDAVLNHKHFGAEYLIGSVLVLAGFVFINFDFRKELEEDFKCENPDEEVLPTALAQEERQSLMNRGE